jgi:outer membrane protein TolC
LTQASGQLARDQALLKNAQLDLERYQTPLAQQAATIAVNQYKAGITSFLAVVVLQANALNAERTGLAILARRLNASVGLIRALGGGWNAEVLAQGS